MNVPDSERRVWIKDGQAELDRFENQDAAILALVLTLTGVIYAILMQVLLYDAHPERSTHGLIEMDLAALPYLGVRVASASSNGGFGKWEARPAAKAVQARETAVALRAERSRPEAAAPSRAP